MNDPDEIRVDDDVDSVAEIESLRQHELDGPRIGKVARARQAGTRAASYCIVAALASAVMAVDLGWRAVRRFSRFHELLRPSLYVLAAIVLVGVIPWLWRRAAGLEREARQSALREPGSVPDFSTLSDGSQIVANLEKIK